MEAAEKRWVASILYRGGVDVEFYFDEIDQLDDLVERGPNFYLITKIVVRLNPAQARYQACVKDACEHSDMPSLPL